MVLIMLVIGKRIDYNVVQFIAVMEKLSRFVFFCTIQFKSNINLTVLQELGYFGILEH